MELLAPAGTWENFLAALESGADAIYMGGKVFNARSHAANFSSEELQEAVRLAHILDVDVYVTVNILIGDAEINELIAYLQELEAIGVDAIIVQDLAVARLARRVAPRLHLHGSTQMTASNLGTVQFLERLGFTRVVLARELSLEEITDICRAAKAEIEVFIHGALCVCYSGQCLMSSFIGGRSGNRGSCAQPCRLPYELLNDAGEVVNAANEGYIMSPKDLNYSEYMKELIEAGVASFKVEGRMKKESYVRQIIGTYRHIIDEAGEVTAEDTARLAEGFNRGFSTAYLQNTTGRAMITAVAPNNQGKEIGHATVRHGAMQLQLTEPVQCGDLLKVIHPAGRIAYVTVDKQWPLPEEQVDVKQAKAIHKGQPKKQKATHDSLYIYNDVRLEVVQSGRVYLAAKANSEAKRRGLQEFTRKHRVYAYLDGAEDAYPTLTLMMESGEAVTVSVDSYTVAIAKKAPTSPEKVREQLGRLGNTLFVLAEVTMPDAPYMWPSSVLNELRRKAVAELERLILERRQRKQMDGQAYPQDNDYSFATYANTTSEAPTVTVQTDEPEQVEAALLGGADRIVFGGDRLQRRPYDTNVYEAVVSLCRNARVPVVVATPRVVRESERTAYYDTLRHIVAAKPDAISVHFLGALEWLQALGYTGAVEGDSSLQVFNSEAVAMLEELGLSGVVASQEATLQQVGVMAKRSRIPISCIVQGYTELMISEYCVINAFAGIGCKTNCPAPCLTGRYRLRDRKGVEFPLRTDPYCRMHIMNSRELDMRAYVPELLRKGVADFRIDARQRNVKWVTDIVTEYKALIAGQKQAPPKSAGADVITRGHYFKGIF